MNEPGRPALPLGHTNRLLAETYVLASKAKTAFILVSLLTLAGCALPTVNTPAGNHACADKVVKSITTNQSVKGVWDCLDSKLQATLSSYVDAGILPSVPDAVFTDPVAAAPPIISTHFVGESAGLDTYTVIVKRSSSVDTLAVLIWVDPDGKVSNVAIGAPAF